ncbi:centromere protein F [Periophthalmus magnuspinnatus]|uniref:centromere protein F n=1 Tax=Periophthalmus magnuspinnatus TaxID=409849 RepID=UPI00145BF2C4|nr:centromere protein F [Periophthalmus magnuspinnatus]
MSWAEEDWTVGLSGKVLQKVKELQVHHERLSRENKQKQLLLDNIQTSLEKQTAKYEEVRVELQSSHRELQRVQEEAKVAITSKERLSQDLQSKQAQVCSLEGQLDAARTLTNKLTQEVKRLEAELEKLQNSSRAGETTLFSTPCWSASPWELSGSRKEARHGNREEGKTQGLHVRRLQFSDMPSGSLPREQPRGTHHHQTSDVFSTPSAAFPWERDDPKPVARRPSPASPKTPCSDTLSQSQLEHNFCVKTNSSNDSETDSSVSELRSRLTDLEEELRAKVHTINTIQNEVAQNKKELSAKEINLQRLRDELSLAHTRMSQEGERASTAEQRAKQLQEELKCQRQNTESSRVQHQQRTKELEKQHQRDLQEFQREKQYMERQHQQEINKLNQELAQARSNYNALQSQLDKESVQKQALVKEVDTLKEKLKWTEGQLQQSQKKEAQTQAKMTETLREAEALTVSLKQSQKKERALEEDGRRLIEERDNALCLLRELQEQKATVAPPQPSLQICPPAQTFSNASQPLHQTRKPNPNTAKHKREEGERREESKVHYPTDREPGEGIDSEHISDNVPIKSEGLQREECRLQTKKEEEVLETDGKQTIAERTPSHSSKTMGSEDLHTENATLRSELRDVREELQKRLDDLEAQRRAETEARTRLKQLSRKNANQITEKEEQYKECKAQLEKESSEVDRLNKALAALETEILRERQEKYEKRHEENNTVLQDKENEMIELNMELKKQLSEVKAQLVLEREEREQQEAEMMNKASTDMEKIQELEAEIEQLKANPNNSSQAEKVLTAANSPVTYLTLREDELNVADETNKPETLSLYQSTNQQNEIKSEVLGNVIPLEEMALIDPQQSPVTVNQNLEQNLEQNLDKTCYNADSDDNYDKVSVLATQVQVLQKQNALEKERANQYQLKLEVLQNQVTQQTQQLTMAFERQSQHISGLLVELQEKENTILCKEDELQQFRQELSSLKDQMGKEERGQDRDKEQPSSICIKNLVTDNSDEGMAQVQIPAVPPAFEIKDGTESKRLHKQSFANDVNSGSEEGADLTSELLSLQQENHLLKLKLQSMTTPKPCGINRDVGSASPLEGQPPTALSDTGVQACTETQQSSNDTEEHEKESEVKPEAGSQQLDHISYLQQQVVALQTKLQALYEENQQKTEELALWRLASEPVCALTESEPVDHQHEGGPGHLQTATQEQSGCVTLWREDEILLSSSSNKLQGRTLFSRLQQNLISEPKTLPPFSVLQDHNRNNSEFDKENTFPTQHNQRNDTKKVLKSLGVELSEVLDCSNWNPTSTEVKATESINNTGTDDMKCVSTQTESWCVPHELQCTQTQTELMEEEAEVESPSVSPVLFDETQQPKNVLLSASFPIPADPAQLAERIRRNRTQLSAAFDDTEYEPYGLPEVVMKGFADIPSGPSCPYIVRRGLLGTTVVPVPPKNTTEAEETD